MTLRLCIWVFCGEDLRISRMLCPSSSKSQMCPWSSQVCVFKCKVTVSLALWALIWVRQLGLIVVHCIVSTQLWQRSYLQAAQSPQEDQRQREEGGGADCGTGQGVLT